MNESPLDDTSDEVLLQPQATANISDLRERVLALTQRTLRRRQWARRATWVVALAACYLAGLATMHLAKPRPNSTALAENEIVEADKDHQKMPVIPKEEDPLFAQSETDPEILEQWAAQAEPKRRPAVFRRAGDGYVKLNDIQSALRCYRQFLDQAAESDLVVDPQDHWLLMSLKNARWKEKRNAWTN